MRISRWLTVVMLGGLIGAATVAAAKTKPPFTAQTLAGTWTGTWKNLKFHSTGPFTWVVHAPDPQTITVDGSGNNFGCGAVGPDVVTLVQGIDWTATGFTYHSSAQGIATVVYTNAKGKFTGMATATCRGSWAMKGKVKGNKFRAKMTTTFPDGQKVHSKASAERQPI